MKADVQMLSETIGERNTLCYENLLSSQAFIECRFRVLGYDVRIEQYEADGDLVANIEAEKRGLKFPEEILLVGAHYDSSPGSPGADDNSTGVAALLELARAFKDVQIDRTLRFVAFVNEEPPFFLTELMGSRVYVQGVKTREEKLLGMICFDSLGYYSSIPDSQQYPSPLERFYPDTGDFIAFVSNPQSALFLEKCIRTFRKTTKFPSEALIAPDSIPEVGFSDHSSFWKEGYHAIMVTNTAFFRNRHYHLPSDTTATIDFERMTRVVLGIGKVLENLSC
jgi:Zn-dependent M28 family amino/carboxypeptidase